MESDLTTIMMVVSAVLAAGVAAAVVLTRRRRRPVPRGYAAATVEDKYHEQLEALRTHLASAPTRKPGSLKRFRKRLKIVLILYVKERFGLTVTRPADIDGIRSLAGSGYDEKRVDALKAVYERIYAASGSPITTEEMGELCLRAAEALRGATGRRGKPERTATAG
jgi:hypothetical protein